MEIVITIIKQKREATQNLDYWLSRPAFERISAVQELREQYFRFFNKLSDYDESRKRLRRFYKVTKRI